MPQLEHDLATCKAAGIDYKGDRLTYAQAIAERLADWSDQARRAGRKERADRLLLAAWDAYERLPAVSPRPVSLH
jgi:hypothetical protein